jgi:hypothetical protein
VEDERRKFQRLLAQNTAFAVLRPDFTRVGRIKDISEGGLAFEYIASYQGQKQHSSEMDIFLSEGSFHISRIPSRVMHDVKIAEEYQTVSDRIETRRCGVQFGALTQEQAAQLNFFLNNHTSERA